MAKSKLELTREYRNTKKDLIDSFKGGCLEQHRTNQYGLFLLAQKYLRNHPELLDFDCSGRGLPAHSYVYGKYLYDFTMDEVIEKRMVESDWFSEYFA